MQNERPDPRCSVGISQRLISACWLQGVDPYTYLVDVLHRVSRAAELTLRLRKHRFVDNPLRSDIDHDGNNVGE